MKRTFSQERMFGSNMRSNTNKRPVQQVAQAARDQQGLALALGFQGVSIAVLSDYKIPLRNFTDLAEHVTGMEIKDFDIFSVPDGKLIYIPAEKVDVQYYQEQKELVLKGPIQLFGRGSTIAYIAQYMAECLRTAQTGSMLIHAAAVRAPISNTSIVILGEKGAGKTTLALRLCHQYGYWLIGNDQIFLGAEPDGTVVTAGGNAWFHLRETAVLADAYLMQLCSHRHERAKPAWNNKMKVDPHQIAIRVATGAFPVTAIFHIRIDQTQSEVHSEIWQGIQRNLFLHECFGRHISGQATPLQDDRGNYLGSLPPINLECALKARDTLVERVIKAGVVEIFAPDSRSAVDFILKREVS